MSSRSLHAAAAAQPRQKSQVYYTWTTVVERQAFVVQKTGYNQYWPHVWHNTKHPRKLQQEPLDSFDKAVEQFLLVNGPDPPYIIDKATWPSVLRKLEKTVAAVAAAKGGITQHEQDKLQARKRQRERQRCGINGANKPGLAQQQQQQQQAGPAAAAGRGAAAGGQDLGFQQKRSRLDGGQHEQGYLQEEPPAAERQGTAVVAAAGADPVAARMHGISLSAAAPAQQGSGSRHDGANHLALAAPPPPAAAAPGAGHSSMQPPSAAAAAAAGAPCATSSSSPGTGPNSAAPSAANGTPGTTTTATATTAMVATAAQAAAAAEKPEKQPALPVGARITLSMECFKITGSSSADARMYDRREYGVAVFEVLGVAGRGGNADALVAQLISFKVNPSAVVAAAAAVAASAAAGDVGVSWLRPHPTAASAAAAADWVDTQPRWGRGKFVLKLTRYPQSLPDMSEEAKRKSSQGQFRLPAALEAIRYQALAKCGAVLDCYGYGVNTQVVRPAAEGGDAAARTFSSSSSWCSGCLANNIGLACLVLPYLQHGSLLARLCPAPGVCRPLSSYATACVMTAVAKALVAMMKADMMFVNLTPGNIMFKNGPTRYTPDVCVMDLERSMPVSLRPRIDGSFGTPGYQAPDTVYTSRSDVFLLGLVCYTCLTGRAPPPGLRAYTLPKDPIWPKLQECEREMLQRCLGRERPFPHMLAQLPYFKREVYSMLPAE